MKPSMRFLRHGGIYRSDMGQNHLNPGWLRRPPVGRRPCPGKRTRRKERVLLTRIVRDEFRPVIPHRVARQHCPTPLHRHPHPKTVPGWATMEWQRTVMSVLTVCLSRGDNRIHVRSKSNVAERPVLSITGRSST